MQDTPDSLFIVAGLLKLVFATETLAAAINMTAKTTADPSSVHCFDESCRPAEAGVCHRDPGCWDQHAGSHHNCVGAVKTAGWRRGGAAAQRAAADGGWVVGDVHLT